MRVKVLKAAVGIVFVLSACRSEPAEPGPSARPTTPAVSPVPTSTSPTPATRRVKPNAIVALTRSGDVVRIDLATGSETVLRSYPTQRDLEVPPSRPYRSEERRVGRG